MLWSRRKERERDERALEEGRLLADRAVRLDVRNRIEVATIGRGRDFDPEEFRTDAEAALLSLAREQEDIADRLDDEGRAARGRRGTGRTEHDYRHGDRRNLRTRARQARTLAVELREAAADPDRVGVLVERARQEAWGDVADQVHRQLRIYAPPPEPEDDPGRDDRIAGLAAALGEEFARRAESAPTDGDPADGPR